jgi:hypothetical protein
MFYHSAASMAWDLWMTCFLKEPIFINPHTQLMEARAMIGGFCCVYRSICGYGAVIDINSSYPAVMLNDMPAYYKTFGETDSIRYFNPPLKIESRH